MQSFLSVYHCIFTLNWAKSPGTCAIAVLSSDRVVLGHEFINKAVNRFVEQSITRKLKEEKPASDSVVK